MTVRCLACSVNSVKKLKRHHIHHATSTNTDGVRTGKFIFYFIYLQRDAGSSRLTECQSVRTYTVITFLVLSEVAFPLFLASVVSRYVNFWYPAL